MKQHVINYELIDHPDAMRAAMQRLSGISPLALDLEMENHYHHYGLHVALIQVSKSDGSTFIFDPLSKIDLRPLGKLLVSRDVELIMHDAYFDKTACLKVYGWKLGNFFDTRIAAQLCGLRQYGLASLLNDLFQIKTDKKYQRKDWLKRPLQKDALDYAARDTGYLFAIREILTRRLVELGRLAWAREEFAFIENTEGNNDDGIPAHYRMKGSASLTPRQLAVLGSLSVFRDELARKLGRPAHFVIRNKSLLQMAVSPPRNVNELKKTRGFHPVVYQTGHAKRLMHAIEQGLRGPEEFHPRRAKKPASTPGYAKRLKALQQWRSKKAADLDIEPYLLLSNDVLGWSARHPGRELPDTLNSRIRDWQRNLVWHDFQQELKTGVRQIC